MANTEDTPEQQQQQSGKKQSGAEPLSTRLRRTKEQYKAYTAHKYHDYKQWLSRPWWFQEKEPLAKFTGWVAAFTFVLVIVAALQLYTLEKTDQTLKETLLASSRAWVVPKNFLIDQMEVGKQIKVRILYENVGKEPAVNVAEYNETWIGEIAALNERLETVKGAWWVRCKAKQPVKGANVIYPVGAGGSGTDVQQFNITLSSSMIPDEALVKGDKAFVMYGCFAYETVATTRHTAFCRVWAPKLGFNTIIGCFAGEYAD